MSPPADYEDDPCTLLEHLVGGWPGQTVSELIEVLEQFGVPAEVTRSNAAKLKSIGQLELLTGAMGFDSHRCYPARATAAAT